MPPSTNPREGRGDAPLPHTTFWSELDESERAALQRHGRLRVYPARSQLVHAGDESDHVIVILKGWTKVTSTTEDGREVVLAVRGPGDLVAESATLGSRRRSATLSALSPVHALVLPAVRFTAFLDSHPRAWSRVTSTFVQRMEDADRRLQAHVSANAPQRVALLLADLAEMSAAAGPPGPDGEVDIGPPLSQQELGSWTDTSRETIARSLAELRRRGLIRTGWRRITVVDVEGLRAYARESHSAE